MSDMPSPEEMKKTRYEAARKALLERPMSLADFVPEEEPAGAFASGSPASPEGRQVYRAMEQGSLTPQGAPSATALMAEEALGGPVVQAAGKALKAAPLVGAAAEGFGSMAGRAKELVKGALKGKADEAVEGAAVKKAVESPAFRRWSDSAPVISAGESLPSEGAVVVGYHGGPEGIEAFRPYTHVGTKAAAEQRAAYMTKGDAFGPAKTPEAKMRIYPVFARIKKPFRYFEKSAGGFSAASDAESIVGSIEGALKESALTNATQRAGGLRKLAERFEADRDKFYRDFPDVDDVWFEMSAEDLMRGRVDEQEWLITGGYGRPDAFRDKKRAAELVARAARDDVPSVDELAEFLRDEGYDSLVYTNKVEDAGKDSYLLLDPEQIKSATGNVGTFDPKDPRIAYGVGAGALAEQARKDDE